MCVPLCTHLFRDVGCASGCLTLASAFGFSVISMTVILYGCYPECSVWLLLLLLLLLSAACGARFERSWGGRS